MIQSISLVTLYRFSRNKYCWLTFIYINLCIFQKPIGSIVLSLGYVYILLLQHIKKSSREEWNSEIECILMYLMGQLLFFGTGHQNTLPCIQYDMGFVGLKHVNWMLSPVFVSLNTFGGPLLMAFASVFDQGLSKRFQIVSLKLESYFTATEAANTQAMQL